MVQPSSATERSYARAWQQYVNGNIVSETSRKYIMNMMSATAARTAATEENSSDEDDGSSESDRERFAQHAGDIDVVKSTLQGIAARDTDEGALGVGRHAASVCLGNELWRTADLTETERRQARECTFRKGSFPKSKDALKAAEKMIHLKDEKKMPFQSKTMPWACLSIEDYGKRLFTCLATFQTEEMSPTAEQMRILERVAVRVLLEFQESHTPTVVEGMDAASTKPEASSCGCFVTEEPLLALIHGLPGTGK